jgi:hypothetical protein
MMKRIIPLFVCALLVTVLVIEAAPAATVTVQNSQAMGVKMDWATGVSSLSGNSGLYKAGARNTAGTALSPTSGTSNKIWFQFDLASTWATYGKANLASATLTLWGENGNTRRFDVSGLVDNYTLYDNDENPYSAESWQGSTLTWNNAPGNMLSSGYLFESSMIYNMGPLWTSYVTSPAQGVALALPAGSTLGSARATPCAGLVT